MTDRAERREKHERDRKEIKDLGKKLIEGTLADGVIDMEDSLGVYAESVAFDSPITTTAGSRAFNILEKATPTGGGLLSAMANEARVEDARKQAEAEAEEKAHEAELQAQLERHMATVSPAGEKALKRLTPKECAERALAKVSMITTMLNLEQVEPQLNYLKRPPPMPKMDLEIELEKRMRPSGLKPSEFFSSNLSQINSLVDGFIDEGLVPNFDALDEEERRLYEEAQKNAAMKEALMQRCNCGQRLERGIEEAAKAAKIEARVEVATAFSKMCVGAVSMIKVMESNLEDRDKQIRELGATNALLLQRIESTQEQLTTVKDAMAKGGAQGSDAVEKDFLEKEYRFLNAMKRNFKARTKDKLATVTEVIQKEFKDDISMPAVDKMQDARWVKRIMRRSKRIRDLRERVRRLETQLMMESDINQPSEKFNCGMQTLKEEDVPGTAAYERKKAKERAEKRGKNTVGKAETGCKEVLANALSIEKELKNSGWTEEESNAPEPLVKSLENVLGTAKEIMTQVDRARVSVLEELVPFVEERRLNRALDSTFVWQQQLELAATDGVHALRHALRQLHGSVTSTMEQVKSEAAPVIMLSPEQSDDEVSIGSATPRSELDATTSDASGLDRNASFRPLLSSSATPSTAKLLRTPGSKRRRKKLADTPLIPELNPEEEMKKEIAIRSIESSISTMQNWVKERFNKDVPPPVVLDTCSDRITDIGRKLAVTQVVLADCVGEALPTAEVEVQAVEETTELEIMTDPIDPIIEIEYRVPDTCVEFSELEDLGTSLNLAVEGVGDTIRFIRDYMRLSLPGDVVNELFKSEMKDFKTVDAMNTEVVAISKWAKATTSALEAHKKAKKTDSSPKTPSWRKTPANTSMDANTLQQLHSVSSFASPVARSPDKKVYCFRCRNEMKDDDSSEPPTPMCNSQKHEPPTLTLETATPSPHNLQASALTKSSDNYLLDSGSASPTARNNFDDTLRGSGSAGTIVIPLTPNNTALKRTDSNLEGSVKRDDALDASGTTVGTAVSLPVPLLSPDALAEQHNANAVHHEDQTSNSLSNSGLPGAVASSGTPTTGVASSAAAAAKDDLIQTTIALIGKVSSIATELSGHTDPNSGPVINAATVEEMQAAKNIPPLKTASSTIMDVNKTLKTIDEWLGLVRDGVGVLQVGDGPKPSVSRGSERESSKGGDGYVSPPMLQSIGSSSVDLTSRRESHALVSPPEAAVSENPLLPPVFQADAPSPQVVVETKVVKEVETVEVERIIQEVIREGPSGPAVHEAVKKIYAPAWRASRAMCNLLLHHYHLVEGGDEGKEAALPTGFMEQLNSPTIMSTQMASAIEVVTNLTKDAMANERAGREVSANTKSVEYNDAVAKAEELEKTVGQLERMLKAAEAQVGNLLLEREDAQLKLDDAKSTSVTSGALQGQGENSATPLTPAERRAAKKEQLERELSLTSRSDSLTSPAALPSQSTTQPSSPLPKPQQSTTKGDTKDGTYNNACNPAQASTAPHHKASRKKPPTPVRTESTKHLGQKPPTPQRTTPPAVVGGVKSPKSSLAEQPVDEDTDWSQAAEEEYPVDSQRSVVVGTPPSLVASAASVKDAPTPAAAATQKTKSGTPSVTPQRHKTSSRGSTSFSTTYHMASREAVPTPPGSASVNSAVMLPPMRESTPSLVAFPARRNTSKSIVSDLSLASDPNEAPVQPAGDAASPIQRNALRKRGAAEVAQQHATGEAFMEGSFRTIPEGATTLRDALDQLSEAEKLTIAYEIVGDSAMALHDTIMELIKELYKRLRLKLTHLEDPEDPFAGLQREEIPNIGDVIDADNTLLMSVRNLLINDSAASAQKAKKTFAKVEAAIMRKRIQKQKVERSKEISNHLHQRELEFLERQEARYLEKMQWLEKQREQIAKNQLESRRHFRPDHRRVLKLKRVSFLGFGPDTNTAVAAADASMVAKGIPAGTHLHRSNHAEDEYTMKFMQRVETWLAVKMTQKLKTPATMLAKLRSAHARLVEQYQFKTPQFRNMEGRTVSPTDKKRDHVVKEDDASPQMDEVSLRADRAMGRLLRSRGGAQQRRTRSVVVEKAAKNQVLGALRPALRQRGAVAHPGTEKPPTAFQQSSVKERMSVLRTVLDREDGQTEEEQLLERARMRSTPQPSSSSSPVPGSTTNARPQYPSTPPPMPTQSLLSNPKNSSKLPPLQK